MKKKIFLITLLMFVMVCLFTITAFAESYNITYYDLWRNVKETVSTDDNGQITIKDTGYSTEANKQFFGWYTMDGDTYSPGEAVTLTENVALYEGYGYLGTQKNIQYLGVTQGSSQWDQSFVQLQEDIVLESRIAPPWGGRVIIDLNGYTITTSAKHAFEEQRAGVILVGEGEVIHTGTGNFFNASSHSYGDGNQRLIVGRDVTVTTNGILLNYTNTTYSVIPIHIFGKATCSKLFHISTLSHNLDVQINAKELVVTGDTFMTVGKFGDNGAVSLNIFGGELKLNESANTLDYWNNASSAEYASKFNISISGGTFNYGADAISDYIVEGYKAKLTEIDGKSYVTIIKDTGCDHNYEITGESAASCIQLSSKTYTCKECSDTYTVTFGEYGEHKWKLTNDKQPTQASIGVRDYECSVCFETKSEIYYNDVANEDVIVTVNTEEGEKEISVKVSDVFVLEKIDENQYKLTDLKAVSSYAITDIVAINVPLGIVDINFASNNSTLKKLVIGDGAIVTVSGFSKCTALTHIEIGASTVTFVKGCSNNVIQSIKSEVQGANVTFNPNVFDGKSSINEIKLSSYSKYLFGGSSFRRTSITEFIAPDYSEVTFKMDPAFYNCNSLEYIYIGKGIEFLEGKAFDYCQKVQKIVLMDVVKLTQEYTFCVEDSGEKPVEVYIHSSSISLPNNTFHKCHGITIYTNAPITNGNVFSNCTAVNKGGVDYPAYTIIYGIPHKFVEAYDAPTCTEQGVDGYKTDCPCGERLDGYVIAKKFVTALTNNETYEEITYVSEAIPATGHFEGEVTYIEYLNGYMSLGLKDCICSVCSETYTEDYPSADELFTFLGYSMPEDGRLEISIGFMINSEAVSTYEVLTGKTLEYGVVAAIADKLDGKAPIESGANIARATIDKSFAGISFKLSGFTDAHKDLGVVMAVYVNETEGDESKLVYLQNEQITLPVAVTINGLTQ